MKRIYMPTFKDQDENVLVIKNNDLTFDSSGQCGKFANDDECKEICRILNLESKGFISVEEHETVTGIKKRLVEIPGFVIDAVCISGPYYDENKPADGQLIEIHERPKIGTWVEVWIEPDGQALSSVFKRDSDGKCYLVNIDGLREMNIDKWANDPSITNRKFFISSNPPEHKDGACSCGKPECKRSINGSNIAAFGREMMDMLTRM